MLSLMKHFEECSTREQDNSDHQLNEGKKYVSKLKYLCCSITNASILINVSLSKMIYNQRIVDLDDGVQDSRDKPRHEGNYYQEVSLHIIYCWSILHSVEPNN